MKQEGVALVPGGRLRRRSLGPLELCRSDIELERALDKIFGLIHRLASARAA